MAGDRATLGTGERQRLYRDLGRYVARDPAADEAVPDDILLSPPSLAVRIFGDGDQSEPCQLALLGAAMVLETAFPRSALVSGSFDRAQAEAARRWAKSVLDVSLALPVRVDAFRLAERLGAHATGEALVSAVDQLYLAEDGAREAAILGIFGRTEAEPWFAAKLRACEGPEGPDARHLVTAYLSARHDLARLTALACADPRGPRWPPEALAAALSAIAQPLHESAVPRSSPRAVGAGVELASIASPAELGPGGAGARPRGRPGGPEGAIAGGRLEPARPGSPRSRRTRGSGSSGSRTRTCAPSSPRSRRSTPTAPSRPTSGGCCWRTACSAVTRPPSGPDARYLRLPRASISPVGRTRQIW